MCRDCEMSLRQSSHCSDAMIEEIPKRTYMLIGGAETTLNISL